MFRSLIFFVCLFLSCCKEKTSTIEIIWTEGRASRIKIPQALVVTDVNHSSFKVKLQSQPIAMLGSLTRDGNDILFEPLVPFTRGLTYEVFMNGKAIGKVKIPEADVALAPELLSVYPTQDTLPANWLKMYLKFSKPMREGVSSRYIVLLKNRDTVRGAFLDLQPELWSEDRTELTVWLDPGRIKRDLIPNRKMGAPLEKGNQYTLMISDRWPDTDGSTLKKPFRKDFLVATRDEVSPDTRQWKITPPSSGHSDELVIDLSEPLDYSVLSSLRISDEKEETISGRWQIQNEERRIKFIPTQIWKAGSYTLYIEERTEDLAGNNLNRLFDQDVNKKSKDEKLNEEISLAFVVR